MEDELEYNIWRKEELKRKVDKLETQLKEKGEEMESLRVTNFENAKFQMATITENDKLTEKIESLIKENSDLKDKIRSKSLENDNKIEDLQIKNSDLEKEIKNLLTCEICCQTFNTKDSMIHHTVSNHQETSLKGMVCKSSDRTSQLRSDMEKHKIKEHTNSEREDILQRHAELLEKITLQKINIVKSLYKLRQIEEKQRETCSCKGFCRILHFRFRWKPSQSEYFYQKFEAIHESSSRVKCNICDFQFNDEVIFKAHEKITHPSSAKYECEKCDETVSEEKKLGSIWNVFMHLRTSTVKIVRKHLKVKRD